VLRSSRPFQYCRSCRRKVEVGRVRTGPNSDYEFAFYKGLKILWWGKRSSYGEQTVAPTSARRLFFQAGYFQFPAPSGAMYGAYRPAWRVVPGYRVLARIELCHRIRFSSSGSARSYSRKSILADAEAPKAVFGFKAVRSIRAGSASYRRSR